MRPGELQRRNRNELGWCLLGFVVVQILLGLGLEHYWPAARDPDFENLLHIVRARQAEAPARPLFLAIGSSRTRLGLCAERLNDLADDERPIVVNCGVDASGPMMHQLVVRRLLDAGIRPKLVFIEIIPMFLSAGEETAVEERLLESGRCEAAEVTRLCKYYVRPRRLWTRWLADRVFPMRRRADLRDALGLDIPECGLLRPGEERDAYGWYGCSTSLSAPEVEQATRKTVGSYTRALNEAAPSPAALQAWHDLVTLCREQEIEVVLVAPPEGKPLRSFAPEIALRQMNTVRDLANELAVPLIDARQWVDDEEFMDGHHTTVRGAEQYTDRFAREALMPVLSRGCISTVTSVERREGF